MSPADVSTLEAPEVKHMPPSSTRSARRQLLNGSSSPNGGCGQSAISAELLTASPKPPRKTMSSTQSPLCSAAAEEEPPLKKARGDNVQAVTQGHQAADPRETHSGWLHTDTQDIRGRGTRDSLADQKLAQLRRNKTNYSSDSEAAPTPQEGGKKKEKVKLGILDLATREFESEVGQQCFQSVNKAAVKCLLSRTFYCLFFHLISSSVFIVFSLSAYLKVKKTKQFTHVCFYARTHTNMPVCVVQLL